MKRKITIAFAAATLAVSAFAGPVAAKGHGPDTACMQAGISTLRTVGLLSAVAKDGLPIEAAVGFGVTVRDGADISGVPNPIPFNVVLADHRAGDNSLFVYPWC